MTNAAPACVMTKSSVAVAHKPVAVTVTVPGLVAVSVAVTSPLTILVPEVGEKVAEPGLEPEPATLKVIGVLYTAALAAFLAVIVSVACSVPAAPPMIKDGLSELTVTVVLLFLLGFCF